MLAMVRVVWGYLQCVCACVCACVCSMKSSIEEMFSQMQNTQHITATYHLTAVQVTATYASIQCNIVLYPGIIVTDIHNIHYKCTNISHVSNGIIKYWTVAIIQIGKTSQQNTKCKTWMLCIMCNNGCSLDKNQFVLSIYKR